MNIMKSIKIITMLLMVFYSVSSFGGGFSNQDIFQQCKEVVKYSRNSNAQVNQGDAKLCMGLIQGFRYGFSASHAYAGNKQKVGVCIPHTKTVFQLATVLVNWMESHPSKMHLPEPVVMALAFEGSFPCK